MVKEETLLIGGLGIAGLILLSKTDFFKGVSDVSEGVGTAVGGVGEVVGAVGGAGKSVFETVTTLPLIITESGQVIIERIGQEAEQSKLRDKLREPFVIERTIEREQFKSGAQTSFLSGLSFLGGLTPIGQAAKISKRLRGSPTSTSKSPVVSLPSATKKVRKVGSTIATGIKKTASQNVSKAKSLLSRGVSKIRKIF